MKDNRAVRERVTKTDDLEMLGRVLRRCECWCHDKAKPVIVAMIPDEDAPLGVLFSKHPKTRLDELAAHPTPLKRRIDRHRAKSEPAALFWGPHFREGYMANDLVTLQGHQRQSQCIGLT